MGVHTRASPCCLLFMSYGSIYILLFVGMLIPHTSPFCGTKTRIFQGFFSLFALAFTPSTWYNNHGCIYTKC
ncbi:hypothetical protein [Clostridium phage Saumur]|nr:hypothetical protein [Clostridium phage Saumur]